jgi:hypothetical protein
MMEWELVLDMEITLERELVKWLEMAREME